MCQEGTIWDCVRVCVGGRSRIAMQCSHAKGWSPPRDMFTACAKHREKRHHHYFRENIPRNSLCCPPGNRKRIKNAMKNEHFFVGWYTKEFIPLHPIIFPLRRRGRPLADVDLLMHHSRRFPCPRAMFFCVSAASRSLMPESWLMYYTGMIPGTSSIAEEFNINFRSGLMIYSGNNLKKQSKIFYSLLGPFHRARLLWAMPLIFFFLVSDFLRFQCFTYNSKEEPFSPIGIWKRAL